MARKLELISMAWMKKMMTNETDVLQYYAWSRLRVFTEVGWESSPETKEFFNLPVLVLKTRCPSGSQPFALVGVYMCCVPEQVPGGIPWVWIDFGSNITLLKFVVSINQRIACTHQMISIYTCTS